MAARTEGTRSSGSPAFDMLKASLRYGAHCLRERVAPPRAKVAGDVPVNGRQITREWLTAVLCADRPGAAVESFTVEDATSGTSSRLRLRLTYNEAGREAALPDVLFAKTTAKFTQRMMLGLGNTIEGEPGFFAHLRNGVDIEAPRGYHGAADQASGRSIVLMEDLVATKGATFCTPRTTVTRPQAEDLVANMATWHARYWESPELTEHASWLKMPSVHFRTLDRLIQLRKRAEVGAKRAGAVIPGDLRGTSFDRVYAAFAASVNAADKGPLTVLHGDGHIGNTYTTAAGRMGFADWQITMRGSWAFDYTYTVTSALAVDDRRAWEKDLLGFYLDRLSAAGVKAPDFDAAWDAYRCQTLYPYLIWLYTIGRGALQPQMQPSETCLAVIERTANAVVDLASLDAIGDGTGVAPPRTGD
ncbi:aminoglycoside phosphotransferase family protein [Yinghuangia sp. ASG 101]|uniref:phosphotransferase n=1 Tax=Yinghuangia sp. ASG 101 TaxID=2896848 RepID=UPI001E5039F4|nr:phosphotransferase [Yinghuangia sp. ASG 101]UGQ13350.1 aminoglycoside phosphotransferase family protein [Yinghuangia sp. ASG 101]